MASPGADLLDLVPEERIVAWTRAFVRQPTEQTSSFEDDPHIQRFLGENVGGALDEIGAPWRRDGLGNVLAEHGEGPVRVIIMAYAMTHPANRMRDAFSGDLIDTDEGPAIRGRGVAEQKSSLAAAIAAFAGVRASGAQGRVVLAVSAAGETGTHRAAEAICAAIDARPEFGIVAIGTNGRVSLANKGRIDVDVTIRGRANHSSAPWGGIDAIRGARRALDRLDALDLSEPRHPRLGPATLCATAIESWPGATHTIQDEVRMTFDRRLLPGQSPQDAFHEIESALGDLAPWTAQASLTRIQLPAEIAGDDALLQHIDRAHAQAGLPVPERFDSHGCTDAGYLQSLGVAPTMWGPGDQAQWHADDERILVCDLVAGARSYFAFLAAVLGSR